MYWMLPLTKMLLAMQLLSFQKAFNGVDIDLRNSPEARAEQVLRCDELQDSLWEMCDQRMSDNDAQLHTLMCALPSILASMPTLLCIQAAVSTLLSNVCHAQKQTQVPTDNTQVCRLLCSDRASAHHSLTGCDHAWTCTTHTSAVLAHDTWRPTELPSVLPVDC